MNIMNKFRIYHTALAVLALLAYVTGELGIIHAWLGYGVAVIIVFRLLWALAGNPYMGLSRFYPVFEGWGVNNLFTHPAISKSFLLGIAVSIVLVTLSGILMDKGRSIGLVDVHLVSTALADHGRGGAGGYQEEESLLKEAHEFFGNLMLFFVGLHVTYLLLFKRPLAKFMLFLSLPNIRK